MIKVKQLSYALLLGGIAITAAYSRDTATEYVAPPDADPKGKAPKIGSTAEPRGTDKTK
jgi:hypothetical protein